MIEIIKIISKKTYVSSTTGKECHYINYYIKLDNGLMVPFKPSFDKYYDTLNAIAILVKE